MSADDRVMIHVDRLHKSYGGPRNAVDHISFDVRVGEVLGFLGPNGAGKTTTMKMLTSFLAPTGGRAEVAGYDVATRQLVKVLLTSGEQIVGHVVINRPPGRDRLSDYAKGDEPFRYVELADRTLLINSAHIVALTEVANP